MTITAKMKCDARNCCKSMNIHQDIYDAELVGWHNHPSDVSQHYCPSCWPMIGKELSEIAAEQH